MVTRGTVSSSLVPGDAIAIIGMSCRLPGAGSPDALWQLLCDGVDAITQVPPDRWNTHEVPTEDLPELERAALGHGGFLDHIDGFDAAFFGISPREATAMDPQQRLMLELSWEALEDAKVIPGRLSGSATGVFTGAIWDDYTTLAYGAALTAHTVTGLHRSIIANRVSYTLGLHGPSIAIDTGQSSSLVAVHLACESLRKEESTLALAGGVNLNLIPHSTLGAARFGGLSPEGRCYTFDHRANGYVRGEGGAVVVLKPLTAALAEGDPIYGVICGGAVNNDGATEGLTVPSPHGQQEVLRQAYAHAGIDPAQVQYVELHGTATRRGDPVEAAALGAVLGRGRGLRSPLLVGSLKTNIGHLEAAAGIAGLIKTALCIKHREIPRSLHYKTPHPQIPLRELRLRVQTTHRGWPRPQQPLIAGVSSFGMGGTNCHWLTPPPPASEVATTGLTATGHGLLGGVTELAGQDQMLLTGRLSLRTHPWLADHAIGSTMLVPGTAFADMALHAGDHIDYPTVNELVLHTPLVVPEQDTVDLQLAVHPGEETDHRRFTIHARPHTPDRGLAQPWVLHASGHFTSTPAIEPSSPAIGTTWPPGAEPIGLEGFYLDLAENGYQYGPTFQGLTTAWRHDHDIYAEAVATHLEASGVQPTSVVLLDPFIPDDVSPQLNKALIYELFARRPIFAANFDDNGITTMGTYLQMFQEWQPQPVAAPTLVVRPAEGIQGAPGEPMTRREWRTNWPLEHADTEVPGDHFTMSVEYVHTTAESVRDWLSTLPVPTPQPHQEK